MSNTEENYLDNLLKAVSEPDEAAPAKEEHAEASIEDKLGASLGIPEDVIPEVTDAEEIPPDEPIVLEDEPEEAVVDTEAIEEPDVPELGETVEEMEQPNEQDEPEFVETVEEPPEPETDEDLFAALMNEDANEDSQEHMSTESDEKPEDDFSIADIESDVPRDIDADNAVEVKVEPESEIDPEIPVMEEEISQEEEPQQEELQQAVTEPETNPDSLLSEETAITEPEEENSEDNAVAATVPDKESSTPQIEGAVASSEAAPWDVASDTTGSTSADDDFSDILEIMDEDPDLAEINDMLKKVDKNEPVQDDDDVMGLLNQMADDESKEAEPVTQFIPESVPEPEKVNVDAIASQEEASTGKKKKGIKKAKKKAPKESKKSKESSTEDTTVEESKEKKTGVLSKVFHLLTDEWEPEPTEEELAQAAEEAKAAKEEADAKKAEDKKAKAEEKKAKAAEKEAAKKAKAEEAAAKKKEKQDAKEAKLAEKRAKEEAEAPKNQKRLSPKKIAVVTVFAASVLAGILLFSNYASFQDSIAKARRAYYAGDYKSVYIETYGEKLDESDSIIEAKSKVILTMQRKLDSYQNHMKLGQNVEALNALITGLQTYDTINQEAESYGVLAEVDSIKDEILAILESNYGLNEEEARALLQDDDKVSYTLALDRIANGT
ncbi:MAG TPA: hypothetical protein DFK11_10250 [Lachnospiraceae bacterium]|nr:hypothetical protein [Lachnospiraceae bacterium]